MPKFEVHLDIETLQRAEEYAASVGLTVEDIIANVLLAKANASPERKDWEPFANPLGMIRLILLVDWNPIGLLGERGTMDEYDRYAAKFYNLLASGASQEQLVARLNELEKNAMGLPGNRPELREVAAKLRRAYDLATAK